MKDNNLHLDRPFELKGYWYLPNDKSERIAGTVKYDPLEGVQLDLIGAFKAREFEVIWGEVEGSRAITLYKSFRIKYSESRFGGGNLLVTSIIASNLLLIGGYFNNTSDLMFYEAQIKYSLIDDWFNISSGFIINQDPKNFKTSINYELPPAIEIPINNTFKLIVNPTVKGPTINHVQKDATITQRILINFQTKKKIHYSEYRNIVNHFLHFLILATQTPIRIEEFKLKFKTSTDRKKLHTVEVFFLQIPSPSTKDALNNYNVLLPYKSIEAQFVELVKKWFELRESLKTSLVPYMANYHFRYSYVSDKFLNMTASLEAFHREFVNADPNYHFIKRLNEILKPSARAFNIALKIRSISKEAEKIKTHRNDFTHSKIPSVQSQISLRVHRLTELLNLSMACTFLNKIGVSFLTLKDCISRSDLYRK